MTTLSSDEKRTQILDHETKLAHQLALLIIDKPKPPIWMIFVPVFFVFFIQKMKQYSSGREDFVENYLKSRRIALEAAMDAEETGAPVNMTALLEKAGNIPPQTHPLFMEWMMILIDHYRLLLSSKGNNLANLVRNGYQNKTNYLLFYNILNKTENAFNEALLPEMHGDSQDIHHVIKKMNDSVATLRRQDADSIFT